MLHFLGMAAVAVGAGAVGYWLRGVGTAEKPERPAKTEDRQKETPRQTDDKADANAPG